MISTFEKIRQRINEARRGVPSEIGNAIDDVLAHSEFATLAGQRDVKLTNTQNGEVLQWDAATGKWVNGIVQGGSAGEWQPVSTVLTAISLLAPSEGVIHQQEGGTFTSVPLADFSPSSHNHDAQYASLNHNHDTAYAAFGHNHNTQYAALVHYHDDIYSPISHNHDAFYISVVTSPTIGNFPVLSSGGELINSSSGPSSFAPAVHNHDTVYAASAITVTGTSSITGGGALTANRTLSLVGDVVSPGANKVYGTDDSGARLWKNDPAGGGGTTITGTGLVPVTNIAALRSITAPADGDVIYVNGYLTAGDNGGGVFLFDAAMAQTLHVQTATIANGGTGYSANTLLTVSTGTSIDNRKARVYITSVTAGAVTGVMIIDKGNYSVTPTLSASATTCVAGTGCTLNLTTAKFDNEGTLIAPTTPSVGMWKRNVDSRSMNVRWFGAQGNAVGDERHRIQKAINAAGPGGSIYLDDGWYIISNSLYLEAEQTLYGNGVNSTTLSSGNALVGQPMIKANDGPTQGDKTNITIKCFKISGSYGSHSIQMLSCTRFLIENISLTHHCTVDNIYASNCWGGTIRGCHFFSGTPISCIHLGRPGAGNEGNHAFTIDRIYTSAAVDYAILVDSSDSAICCGGLQITNCCLQAATIAQVALLSVEVASITGLYTENGGRPIILGDMANSRWASSVHLSGCHFLTYTEGSPMLLGYCRDVVISGCNLNANGARTQCLHYNYVFDVSIISCYPTNIHGQIRRTATATQGLFIQKGQYLTDPPSITIRSSAATGHQHFKMSINGSGAWVAEEWIPALL